MPTAMQKIDNIDELNALRDQQRAVVFLWVDWAIHARHSARAAEEMSDRWNHQHNDATIALSQVDLTEQSGEMWDAMNDWLASQDIADATGLLYGGAGAVIWIRSGEIIRYVINANAETVDGLLEIMNHSFGSQEPTDAT